MRRGSETGNVAYHCLFMIPHRRRGRARDMLGHWLIPRRRGACRASGATSRIRRSSKGRAADRRLGVRPAGGGRYIRFGE